ncbi:MAG TPA: hypothetical protein VGM37_19255 [Armatimonadota bacterium]
MKCFYRRAAMWMIAAAVAVGAAGQVRAQQKTLTVAVLPFSNSSGSGGALTSKTATAAVETQLMDSGRYDVVKRDLVNKTMTDLNLTYPLDRTGISQLAQALEADGVVSGDVLKVARLSKTNQVRVTLRLEMTDRSSGELTNGAIVSGDSGIRPDFSGAQDVLLDEAVSKAAFAAVRSMNERILPEGTVFATSTRAGQTEALLNIGTNSGVRTGMEFIVLRNREQVGRLKITGTSPTDATAAVIATTRGVQPEDKVRAVFRLENIPSELGGSGDNGAKIARPKMNLGGLAVGALALLGLTKISHGSFSEGRSARQVKAVSSGPFNGAPVADSVPGVPVNHITWLPPAGVLQSDVIGYAVYREDQMTVQGGPATIAGRGQTGFYDTGRAIDVPADTNFGTDDSKNNGLVPGEPTRYRIRTAYYDRTSDTTGTTTTTVVFAQDVISSSATPILPPPTVSAAATDVTSVTFTFKVVPGADRYIVQVANNPAFNNADNYPKGSEGSVQPIAPVPLVPIEYWGTLKTDSTTNITTCDPTTPGDCVSGWDPRQEMLAGVDYAPSTGVLAGVNLMTGTIDPTVGTLYWRVGARSSRDDYRPENGGWVYGTAQTLTLAASVAAMPIQFAHSPVGGLRPVDGLVVPPTTSDNSGTSQGASHGGRAGRN